MSMPATDKTASQRLSVFGLCLLAVCLLLFSPLVDAEEKSARELPGVKVFNPAAELWRDVRQREAPVSGKTQVGGVETGVLINATGDRWRQFRMDELIPVGGYVIGAIIVLLLIFYMVRGRVPIEGGASDRKLPRYTTYERMVHWFIASVFLFLAITGLILLFGRPMLIPLFGKEGFSIIASACKEGHNLMGPLFLLALVMVFFQFVRRNIYQKGDLTWLLRGGGIIGKKHVPSNFFNMGEKTMFWLLVFVGSLIGISGLVLVFPVLGLGREFMALAHVGHAIGALLMIAVIIGHIYIGTVGMEGAIEGMKTGYCDLNWAKEHHDLWATKAIDQGEAMSNEAVASLNGEKTSTAPPGATIQGAGK
ncbi:MAG: formate dehydrogenase subunit gamma [Candidatus Thiodiazotropha sp. (ex Monitilora ramsayi)]|nr:formate dehydrogenase subunit gamma [Candidatus Thiodiazotropha sp. (ex Monitilora ramsayi)]